MAIDRTTFSHVTDHSREPSARDRWISVNNPRGASSNAGHDGFARLGVYCATKFAVRALTQSAAKEYASAGITVNAYCPGVVGTDMWVTIDERFAELTGTQRGRPTRSSSTESRSAGHIPLEDVAAFVSYPAGPDSDYMTGQAGLIDGGLVYR